MLINNDNYFRVLENVKAQIKNAQYRAVLGVNREQIFLFWNIGKVLIENSKYGSGFIENRYYSDIEGWNQSFEGWLERTGNGRTHGTTKRKPAEMFLEEREHLLPLFGHAPENAADFMDRAIRLDNTVLYLSNRYSLPLGTYGREKTVTLRVRDNALEIMDRAGETIAIHEISAEKGKLIKLESHRRDRRVRTEELLNKTVALLGTDFREYLTALCETKPRYIRDQFKLVIRACETYGRECVLAAMRYCQEMDLYSAVDLNDAAAVVGGSQTLEMPERLPVEDERYHVNVQKRALSVYADVVCVDSLRGTLREGGVIQ